MTVFVKNITYGLETRIKEFQNYLNTKLASYWSGEIEIYGLVYKNERDGIIVPEAYKGTGIRNKEYESIFIDDRVACTIGFLITDRALLPYRTATLDIIFSLQIDKIYSTTTRDSERALLQAEKIIESFGGVGNVLDLKEGIEDVFSEFDTSKIKNRDMHPWYVFSFSVELNYTDDSCQ